MNDKVVDMKGKPVKPDNVVDLDVTTLGEIPVDKILEGAKEAKLDNILILGWDETGKFYFASSQGSVGEINLLLDVCKDVLMSELRDGQ